MADLILINESETAANSQVTDSISQANAEVIGLSPANASGNYLQGTSLALGLAALNATSAQQQNCISMNASTPLSIHSLYALDTGNDGTDVTDIFGKKHKLKIKRAARIKISRR